MAVMAELRRLSVNQLTLPETCSMPEFVDVLVRNGVPYASLWRDKVREFGVQATAHLVADRGLGLSGYCFAGLLNGPDRAEAARARDEVRRTLDEAAALKAPCLVFIAGGIDPRDRNIADARARALAGIAGLIPHARSVGVKLAIKPMHPMMCAARSVLSTMALANDWCDQLQAEDIIGIAVDTYSVWWDPAIEEGIARAGARICAMQVNDWLSDTQDLRLDRGMMGDGVIDIQALRRMVDAAGYAGPIEVEILSKRNWWCRGPEESTKTIIRRFATVV
jgi:sugar phosphate isomerase/epimerase